MPIELLICQVIVRLHSYRLRKIENMTQVLVMDRSSYIKAASADFAATQPATNNTQAHNNIHRDHVVPALPTTNQI